MLEQTLDSLLQKAGDSSQHGLINYLDTKAKCRHMKILIVKVLCGRCYQTGDIIIHVGIFDPAL
jgi:hypothetical protein